MLYEYWCFEIFRVTTIGLGEKWGKGIPIPTTWRIWDVDVDEPIVLFPVRESIGALLWIALLTRMDIANAMRAVARYCRAPQIVHWKAAFYILGYAVRTSSFGITFQRGTVEGFIWFRLRMLTTRARRLTVGRCPGSSDV